MDRRKLKLLLACLSVRLILLFQEMIDSQAILLKLYCDYFVLLRQAARIRDSPAQWVYARSNSYLDQTLLSSYSEKMFKNRMRVSKSTFTFLCSELAPLLQKQDTRMRAAVDVKSRVAVGLHRLATGATLKEIGDLYGMGEATVHKAVLSFCEALDMKLRDMLIQWPSLDRFKVLAQAFEELKGIPFVVGAIDGSHLPIMAPSEDPQQYFNRKGFHSILLQLIVSADCLIWDYDLGWPGCIHDWSLFQRTEAGKRIMSGYLGEFCLVGDAAYPPRPYMLSPFKGSKNGLERYQQHWNFLQSSTRMAVERAFGMLKARFRILLKRNDTNLKNLPSVVGACLLLHNLCIIHKDGFDHGWIDEAKEELKAAQTSEAETSSTIQQLKSKGVKELARVAAYGLHRVQGASPTEVDQVQRGLDGFDQRKEKEITEAERNASRRNALARTLYQTYTGELIRDEFGDQEESDEESSMN